MEWPHYIVSIDIVLIDTQTSSLVIFTIMFKLIHDWNVTVLLLDQQFLSGGPQFIFWQFMEVTILTLYTCTLYFKFSLLVLFSLFTLSHSTQFLKVHFLTLPRVSTYLMPVLATRILKITTWRPQVTLRSS